MSAATEYSSTDVCLAFKDLSICTLVPPKPILSNVSGFVAKGSITAVFGASASGKSLLLQALSARVQSLSITGNVFLNGKPMDPSSNENSISYVSQETMLIGDLTAKEMVTNSARLKTKMPLSCVEESVDAVLKDFGLDHVADTYIGTIFRAGLSGGQKRRVDVAVELVSAPSLLLLDEPTSGLDGSIAYDVLSTIRKAVKSRPASNSLSVMLSIHQPNSRILGLFDHILVLGDHGMVFFGTVAESVQHFTQIGYAPPAKYTPTDYYLNITDTNFTKNNKFDFVGAFNSSQKWAELVELVDLVESRGQIEQLVQAMSADQKKKSARSVGSTDADDLEATIEDKQGASRAHAECMLARNRKAEGSSFWNQVYVLVKRDYTLAARDPTMYVLQVVLVLAFGLMVGAVFFDLKYRIDSSMTYIPGALLWIVMVMVYIQVFKVYHLNKANQRFAHEHTNGSYSVLACWVADLLSVASLLVSYIPGTAIAFFMIGFPGKAFPFVMLLFWMSALTSESMLGFITKFFKDISASVVASQLVLVLLTAFGSGLFIRWQDTPAYWEWLQALSMFTHASRAAMLSVMRKLTYECRLAGDGNCYGPSGEMYECIAGSVFNGKCDVSGTTVLYITQGVPEDESYWKSFGYLVALFVGFRLASLLMMYFPFEHMVFAVQKQLHSPDVLLEVLTSHLKIKQLEQRVERLMSHRIAYEALAQTEGTVETIPSMGVQRSVSSKRVAVAAVNAKSPVPIKQSAQANDDAQQNEQSLRLSWTNLDLVLKKGGKKLIDNVSGSVKAGKVLALMGPSGAGKTTLLNALANRAPYGNVTGEVRFGGLPLTSKDLMYVPQFDEIKGYTTVVEQIELVGLMKCKDQRAMRKRLIQLLQILGLFEKANVLCKDLSGGELKRLSVGMGMISSPKVLFLDEPTTGLDSTAAFYLVQFLVDLARDLNVPVIMTIHQPAVIVFDMLPELYLLEGGRLAFFGPVSAAENYFSDMGFACPAEVNPADFYLNLIYKAPVGAKFGTWREIYYDSAMGQEMVAQLHKEKQAEERLGVQAQVYDEPAYWSRFYHLTAFFLRYYWVNPGYYIYRSVYLVLCAVYIGTLYLNLETNTSELVKYSGSIFFSIWATLFAAVGSTGLIASDRRQSFEQIKNGIVTPSISCASMFLASLPYNLVCAFAFQLIFHWVSGINPSGESFMYAVILTMGHTTMMEAIMNIVVEVVKDAMLSVTCAMLVMGVLFLFPGFFIQVSAMPEWISWISWIIPTKYSFDGYLSMIFTSQDFDVQGTGMVISGKDILIQLFDNKNVNAWGMIGVLIAYIVLFRLVHYALFLYSSLPFLSNNEGAPSAKQPSAVQDTPSKERYHSVAQSGEVEMV